jgi:hypothetical protein
LGRYKESVDEEYTKMKSQERKSTNNSKYLFTKDKIACIQRMFAHVKTTAGNVKVGYLDYQNKQIHYQRIRFYCARSQVIVTSIPQDHDKKSPSTNIKGCKCIKYPSLNSCSARYHKSESSTRYDS